MTADYHTASRRGRNRFQFWQNLMCRSFAPAYGSTADADNFDAHFSVRQLGATTVCKVSAPPQYWERSALHVRRKPKDDYLLTQLVSGSGLLRQNGHELILKPGIMALYDTNLPYSYEVGGEVLFVKIPRRSLLAHVAEPPNLAVPLSRDDGITQLASGILQQAASLDAPTTTRTSDLVGSTVLHIIAALLSNAPTAAAGAKALADQTLLDRVRFYITTHLGDASLNLSSIARAQAISERSLNRLFSALGTTPMKWVLRERLAASLHSLQQDPTRRITDVAFENGFNDLSHFSRVFKKEFQLSPHQICVGFEPKSLSK